MMPTNKTTAPNHDSMIDQEIGANRLWLPTTLLRQPHVSALLANCWISTSHEDGNDDEFAMPDHVELGWMRQVFIRARREALYMGWVEEIRVLLPKARAPALYRWGKTARRWQFGESGGKDVVLVSVCPCCRMVRPIAESAGPAAGGRRILSS